ncbi:unnamed protein product [Durusdinium trenchii]|uniref:Uncharacterized protein n=1 Tax=Durusdinium trenchii TaxID=1381693 RepID=A0ABP0MS79_9DINO
MIRTVFKHCATRLPQVLPHLSGHPDGITWRNSGCQVVNVSCLVLDIRLEHLELTNYELWMQPNNVVLEEEMPLLKACSTAEAPEPPRQQSPWLSHLGWHGSSAGALHHLPKLRINSAERTRDRNSFGTPVRKFILFRNELQCFLTSCPQGISNETRPTSVQTLLVPGEIQQKLIIVTMTLIIIVRKPL